MMTWIMKSFILASALFLAGLCEASDCDISRFVDPFVGTSATGHTFPAACVPLGLVQAGPDTGNGTWEYCSGYRYDDKTIYGFTQTHLNGTGATDLGDVSLLPLSGNGEWGMENGMSFDKATEVAEPGYYAVTLDGGIRVEIAAAEHSAIYRIRGKEKMRILVDCGGSGKQIENALKAIDVDPRRLTAIVVTHSHDDHIRGVGVLSRRYDLPVYASVGTWDYLIKRNKIGSVATKNIRVFQSGKTNE